jgi:hypothetical protein
MAELGGLTGPEPKLEPWETSREYQRSLPKLSYLFTRHKVSSYFERIPAVVLLYHLRKPQEMHSNPLLLDWIGLDWIGLD